MFGVVIGLLFLVGFGTYGFLLLTNPIDLPRRARVKRYHAPFYELTGSRSGRLQMRLVGLIFLVASICGAVVVIHIGMGYK